MIYRTAAIALLSLVATNLQATESSPEELRYLCRDQLLSGDPFDYDDPDPSIQNEIRNIERHHFNSKVQSGAGGQTGYLIGDLAFVLRNVPNHHPALNVMGKYYLGGGSSRGHAPADCFFMLAKQFRPHDGVVALIYGIFLAKSDRVVEAERQYKFAIDNLIEPAEAHYDLALLYLKSGQNQQAYAHAKIAYERGYPLPGLKNNLRRLGFDIE